MPIPALVMGGMAAASALAGLLGNRKQKQTQESRSNSTSSESSQVMRRRALTTQQQDVLDPLAQTAIGRIMNPAESVAPFRADARNQVNALYSGAPDALASKYLSFGGNSGKFARAAGRVESERLSSLSALEPQFAQLALQNQDAGLSLAERLLGMNFGEDVYSSGTSSSSGSSSGSTTTPGNMAAGGLQGGTSMLGLLLALSGKLK